MSALPPHPERVLFFILSVILGETVIIGYSFIKFNLYILFIITIFTLPLAIALGCMALDEFIKECFEE